jgi:thymidine kinase
MAYASVTELSLKGCLDDIIGVMACMNASKTAEVDIAQDRINQLYMNSLVFNWIGNSRDVKEKDLETGESQLVSERRIGGKKLEISAFLYDELNPQGVYNRLDTRDAELESLGKGYVHMICLDEGHLPDPKHFIPMVKKLRTYADKPRIVLVSLLDRDFKGQKYETAKFIESHGIVVSKSACCRAIKSDGTDCGLQARRTLRVVKREHGDGLNE